MKLFRKLADVPVLKFHVSAKDATRHFLKGLEKHAAFNRGLKQLRRDAIEAGFYFLQARSDFPHGDWEIFLNGYAKQISKSSVRFYMELADLSLRWARYKHGEITDPEALREKAIELVLVSPKPIIALARELGHMLKFGGYFEDDYQEAKKKKLRRQEQAEFEWDFQPISKALAQLRYFGDEKHHFIFEAGIDRLAALRQAKADCETALEKLNAALAAEPAIEA